MQTRFKFLTSFQPSLATQHCLKSTLSHNTEAMESSQFFYTRFLFIAQFSQPLWDELSPQPLWRPQQLMV